MILPRVFTLPEANALVPLLDEHLGRIERLTGEVRGLHEHIDVPAPSADAPAVAEAGKAHDAMRKVEEQIRAEVLALLRVGAHVTALAPPTVDLPARLRGRRVHLSYVLGEDEVAHWHTTESGEARWRIEDTAAFGADLPQ